MARTNLDDFPVSIHLSRSEAESAANQVSDEQFEKLADLFGVDYSGQCNISIVGFDDSGMPVEFEIMKDVFQAEVNDHEKDNCADGDRDGDGDGWRSPAEKK